MHEDELERKVLFQGKKEFPILQGEKVYLARVPDDEDFYRLYRDWVNTPRVMHGIGDARIYSLEEIIRLQTEWRESPANLTLCVYDKETNEPLGDVNLRYDGEQFDNEGPEIAVMIGKEYGEGKGTEAVKLLLQYAFKHFDIEVINLSVFKDNTPAVKLYRRRGFRAVEEISGARPEYIMELTKEEHYKLQKL